MRAVTSDTKKKKHEDDMDIGAFTKGGKKGDKGKGGKKGGKDKGGKKGKGQGSNYFEGWCDNCGLYGHRKVHCRKKGGGAYQPGKGGVVAGAEQPSAPQAQGKSSGAGPSAQTPGTQAAIMPEPGGWIFAAMAAAENGECDET
eukprot:2211194-Alexandrium_andersonii.AAC.1